MIKLIHLDKYFFKNKRNEIHVINNVSLTLNDKGLVVIHGPSGSGKTTLLNVIGGLDKVNSGSVDFFNEYINKYDAKIWDQIRNEHIGYIFQNYYLLPELSVYENIRFVLKILGISDEEYIESRVNYVLKAVGMYPFRKKKALQLSGGQQQRVAIARALVKNPKVVIADEPTGNLDSKNTIEIMNIIKEIAKDKAVILVTHEKSIANIYADRIIEVSDGKIINDIYNDEKSHHSISDDDTIYLKDLVKETNLMDDKLNVSLYKDKLDARNLNIKLIVKNDTLYLDIDSPYDKIKLNDKNSNILIKDEHYVQKTKEELLKTSFRTEEIDNSKIKRDKSLILSFKQTFKMALDKLLKTSRKGKLMLFSFFIAGMVIAFAISTLASVAIIRPEQYVTLPKGYVEVVLDKELKYEDLLVLKDNDDRFFINPFYSTNIYFLNNDNSLGINIYAQLDTSNNQNNYKLTYGRYSAADNEIVLSSGLAETFLKNQGSQDFGIWNLEQLLLENIHFGNTKAKVVGVVDLETNIIFSSNNFNVFQINKNSEFEPFSAYENILTYGNEPFLDEVVISEEAFYKLTNEKADMVSFPYEIIGTNFQNEVVTTVISGVHNYEKDNLKLKNLDTLYKELIEARKSLNIYSKDPNNVIFLLDKYFQLEGTNSYEYAYKQRLSEQKVEIIASLSSTGVIILFSLVGFYFVIRSSLIERIYEVSVYRALGVKKNDIFRSFFVEIVVLTTISTLVGYILMTVILTKLQKGLLGQLNFFYVAPLSTLVGVIILYTLNLLAGILPIIILLKKTPAEILAHYDI